MPPRGNVSTHPVIPEIFNRESTPTTFTKPHHRRNTIKYIHPRSHAPAWERKKLTQPMGEKTKGFLQISVGTDFPPRTLDVWPRQTPNQTAVLICHSRASGNPIIPPSTNECLSLSNPIFSSLPCPYMRTPKKQPTTKPPTKYYTHPKPFPFPRLSRRHFFQTTQD